MDNSLSSEIKFNTFVVQLSLPKSSLCDVAACTSFSSVAAINTLSFFCKLTVKIKKFIL